MTELADVNLLVSSSWRAPGRSRREIIARLRALGDPAPVVTPTERKGIIAVRTSLDPRMVIRGLRAAHQSTPEVFRCTFKWVPVDLWSAADLEALRQAVTRLRDRIAPDERWRLTIERRADVGPPLREIIEALATLVDRKVDLGHPDKILRVELFADRAALAVVTSVETFSPSMREKERKGTGDGESASA